MHALRVVGLVVIVAVTGLLSGGAASAVPAAQPGATRPAVAPEQAAAVAAPQAAAPAVAAPQAAPAAAPAPAAPPARPAAAPIQAVAGTPCAATARACIQLSSQRAWLIRDGVVRYGPVPITSGRAGYRTPTGSFRVSFKDRNHRSSIFNNAPMPWSVFFSGGIAFHQGSLSVPSHGCIHLSAAAAQAFFGSLSNGDVVQVTQ